MENKTNRIISLDRFRGLTIMLMVLANFYFDMEAIPPWLKHAEPPGWTLVDLIAPAFFFAIALTMPMSLEKRIKQIGKSAALGHAFSRGFMLLGIGIFVSALECLFVGEGDGLSFGVLETIGFAIILTVPFIRVRLWFKLAVALVYMSIHHFITIPSLGEYIYYGEYQILGMLGPASLVLLALSLSDLWFKCKTRIPYLTLALIFAIGGLFLAEIVPADRHVYSMSFSFLSTGIVACFFYIVHVISVKWLTRPGVFCSWGHNPLVLFLLDYVLILGFLLPSAPWWYVEAHPLLIVVQTLGILTVMHLIVMLLERKKIILKI